MASVLPSDAGVGGGFGGTMTGGGPVGGFGGTVGSPAAPQLGDIQPVNQNGGQFQPVNQNGGQFQPVNQNGGQFAGGPYGLAPPISPQQPGGGMAPPMQLPEFQPVQQQQMSPYANGPAPPQQQNLPYQQQYPPMSMNGANGNFGQQPPPQQMQQFQAQGGSMPYGGASSYGGNSFAGGVPAYGAPGGMPMANGGAMGPPPGAAPEGGPVGTGPQCPCGAPTIELTVRKEGPNCGRLFFKCAKRFDEAPCNYFQWADEPAPAPPSGPQCGCGIASKGPITVRKEGPNQGRPFFSCSRGQQGGCNFFQWGDEEPGQGDRGVPTPARATTAGPPCNCQQPSAERTVRKEGPNTGRVFFVCSKGQGQGCDYFQWADEQAKGEGGGKVGGGKGGGFGNKGGAGSGDVCYKCNMTGHWASNCPNEGGGGKGKGGGYDNGGKGKGGGYGNGGKGKGDGSFQFAPDGFDSGRYAAY